MLIKRLKDKERCYILMGDVREIRDFKAESVLVFTGAFPIPSIVFSIQ